MKIAFTDFWGSTQEINDWFEIDNYFLRAFRKHNVDYEVVNPYLTKCDIVIFSNFQHNIPLTDIKGAKCRIYYDGENWINEKNKSDYDYSLSFKADTDTNLYLPLWQINYDRFRDNKIDKPLLTEKNVFCSRLVSTSHEYRERYYDFITENYKPIISAGNLKNNLGYNLIGYKEDFKAVQDFHKNIKFNLCFENKITNGDTSYITEKIIHAYAYGTVPIYYGAENVTEWFNPDSFINCYGLTEEEVVEKIKEIDSDDSKYYKMLNENPFKIDRDWKEYSYDRLIYFLKGRGVI